MYINFKNLEIREVGNSSGVFSGVNRQKGFSHISKEIQSIGSIDGNFNKVNKNLGISKNQNQKQ
ncbi:hypothetical protein ABE322_29700 [Priestia megaterium]